jgi:hypothetical protein
MRAIQDASREVATLQAQAAPNEMKVEGLNRQIEDANANIDALVKQLGDGSKALAVKVAPVEARTKIAAADLGDSYAAVASRVQRLEQIPAAAAEVKPLREEADRLSGVNDQITQAEDVKKGLEDQSRTVQSEINDNRQRLVSKQTLFGGNFEQVETEIESLKNSSPFGIGATLAQIHPTFLSALLVCMMGALGSLLFLFPAYIANRPGMQITFDTIVVRTVFGAVVAFAFFIVANLGIAVFGVTSSGAAAAPGASLNPFTVAGLGIVAGVMGDDIAKWIHDRGAYLFKSAGDGGGLADVARTVIDSARPPPAATATATASADLPSGGLVNPHGGPNDPA